MLFYESIHGDSEELPITVIGSSSMLKFVIPSENVMLRSTLGEP
jgi:hypothetical protein